ncbi:MAG: DNRLRE domain-containing protein [Desulfobacteraceae bacterium]|jgi:hypothetical protein
MQTAESAEPIVADHTSTDISAIPQTALEAAKANLRIAYGHTSHGSQLITGMNGLVDFANNGGKGLSLPEDFFSWNNGGSNGALDLRDQPFSDALDLGNPDRTAWADATRSYLNTHPQVNVIIWSWCGQADTTEENINTYLTLMSQLEADYPDVRFVYMTGHLNGSGLTGNLHLRNEQIRNYCINNDKILYDFADIESYDPDGLVNYNALLANDNCDYDSDNNGSRDKNWAVDWQDAHTRNVDWYACTSVHSQPLNANQKAYAAWWLWARLAGWGECTQAPGSLNAVADSDTGQITLNWTDNSDNEDSFIIQRRVDNGTWDAAHDSVAANVTTFADTGLATGTYQYRVVAHRDNDGSGNPCDSGNSNTAQAQIIDPNLPAAPSALTATADSVAGTITLAWTDNADNEDEFVIQRQVDGGGWNNSYATVGENAVAYLDSGLAAAAYNYRVIAKNSYGDSNPSNTASANIVQSVPDAPSGLTSEVSGFDITLSWTDNSDNEDAFVVERSVDGGAYAPLVDDLAPDTQSYTDANLEPLHTYTYRVKAANSFGSSAYSNETEQYIYDQAITIILNNDDTGEVIDAFLRSTEPDTNFGSTSYTTSYDRFIIQFNLPAEVMGKKIISAEISFYVYSVDPGDAGTQLELFRVTRQWEEGSVTWNTPWLTAGGDIGESVGQVTVEDIDHAYLTPVDITGTVQHWADGSVSNFGLILDKGPDVGMGVKASEYPSPPYLSITYTNKVCADFNTDGDVDGEDLWQLANDFDPSCLSPFATAFGR